MCQTLGELDEADQQGPAAQHQAGPQQPPQGPAQGVPAVQDQDGAVVVLRHRIAEAGGISPQVNVQVAL